MIPLKNEAAVLFSGGIDSLTSALSLSLSYNRIHLLTFHNGYLEFGLENTKKNSRRLKDYLGPGRINHVFLSTKSIFNRISVHDLMHNRSDYGMEISWCVACRTSMNVAGLIYVLENRLAAFADGSNRAQIPRPGYITGTPENYPLVVDQMKAFAAEYGIDFLTPNYDLGTREDRRKRLSEMGFFIDFLSKDKGKGISSIFHSDFFHRSQPVCLSGWLVHWRRNLLAKPEHTSQAETLRFVQEKQSAVIKEIISDYFQKKNIDINALVKERRQILSFPDVYPKAALPGTVNESQKRTDSLPGFLRSSQAMETIKADFRRKFGQREDHAQGNQEHHP